MRTLAITGMLTASWMPAITSGSDMRATPPSRRMSAGTRSSAITDAAPASSATLAWSGVTTSMMTPPLSISAKPALTANVASSRIPPSLSRPLLQPERADAVVVLRAVLRVDAVGEGLDDTEQRRVRPHVGGAVGGVVELDLCKLGHLRERRIGDRRGAGVAMACELHGPDDERVRAPRRQPDDERVAIDAAQAAQSPLCR